MIHPYHGIYSAIKSNNKLLIPTTEMNLKIIMLSERSQAKAYICMLHDSIYLKSRKCKLIYSDRSCSVVEGMQGGRNHKGTHGNFWGDGYVLYPSWGDGLMGLCQE